GHVVLTQDAHERIAFVGPQPQIEVREPRVALSLRREAVGEPRDQREDAREERDPALGGFAPRHVWRVRPQFVPLRESLLGANLLFLRGRYHFHSLRRQGSTLSYCMVASYMAMVYQKSAN